VGWISGGETTAAAGRVYQLVVVVMSVDFSASVRSKTFPGCRPSFVSSTFGC
jgi:hypothetical protein